jgi:hypothetical protein
VNDGSQLLVTTTTTWLAQALDAAARDPHTYNRLTSLMGRGPFYVGQDWLLLDREQTDSGLWDRLVALSRGGP